MIRRTLLLIGELVIYGLIMSKLHYLNEYTMIIGVVTGLFIMAFTLIEDLIGELREARKSIQILALEFRSRLDDKKPKEPKSPDTVKEN